MAGMDCTHCSVTTKTAAHWLTLSIMNRAWVNIHVAVGTSWTTTAGPCTLPTTRTSLREAHTHPMQFTPTLVGLCSCVCQSVPVPASSIARHHLQMCRPTAMCSPASLTPHARPHRCLVTLSLQTCLTSCSTPGRGASASFRNLICQRTPVRAGLQGSSGPSACYLRARLPIERVALLLPWLTTPVPALPNCTVHRRHLGGGLPRADHLLQRRPDAAEPDRRGRRVRGGGRRRCF